MLVNLLLKLDIINRENSWNWLCLDVIPIVH